MDSRVFTEPQQGASYEQLLAVAQTAEQAGFDAFFRSDHFLKMGDVTGLPGPTDAWVTLGAIARETSTIRLGTLVSAATFRLPGPLAVAVSQVDQMSEGRVELGLGTGWYEAEHRAYGIPFPSLSKRFSLLEEQLEIITGLWATSIDSTFDYEGEHYQFTGSPALPKPYQKPPPIIIGGRGRVKTASLAARFANEWNAPFASIDQFRAARANIDLACESHDRDPATLQSSIALVVCCGTSEAEISERARIIGREVGELRENGCAGSPDEVVAKLAEFAEAGAERVYFQVLDLDDLDHIKLLGSTVLPAISEL